MTMKKTLCQRRLHREALTALSVSEVSRSVDLVENSEVHLSGDENWLLLVIDMVYLNQTKLST